MKIDQVIRQRRRALGYTQEQVAGYLGVTAPAVNKWERGASYPDITLLPALARLLDTDLNTLLSFQEDLTEQEIALFLNQLVELAEKEGVQRAADAATDKIRQFPTCFPLLLNVATVLEGVSLMGGTEESCGELVEGLYRRAAEGDDPAAADQARAMLMSKYLARRELARAEELLNALPEAPFYDKRQLRINLLTAQERYPEAAKAAEEKLLATVNDLHATLMSLVELALKEGREEDAGYIAGVAERTAEALDQWDYVKYAARFQLCMSTRDLAGAKAVLSPMLRALDRVWETENSPLYRHIQTKAAERDFGEKLKRSLTAALLRDPEAAFLTEDPEVMALLHTMNPMK